MKQAEILTGKPVQPLLQFPFVIIYIPARFSIDNNLTIPAERNQILDSRQPVHGLIKIGFLHTERVCRYVLQLMQFLQGCDQLFKNLFFLFPGKIIFIDVFSPDVFHS